MRKNLLLGGLLFAASSSFIAARQLPIAKPEEFAGRWETSDGHGGMVGINVIVSTHIDGAPTSLLGHQQYLDEFTIGIYQRTGPDVEPLGFSFFTSGSNGGATWDGQHLRVLAPQRMDLPKVDVDLMWNETGHVWNGHFEHGEFSRQVTLKRPENIHSSPLVGTWFDSKGLMNNCVHVAQQSDGGFTAWSDDVSIPGRMRYASGIQPPPHSRERYGEIAKARAIPPGQILVELRAYTSTCCSHPFTATISSDGSTLVGNWPSGPNQASRSVEWKKMPDDSCLAAASEPVPH
jgi:hypothetical protein